MAELLDKNGVPIDPKTGKPKLRAGEVVAKFEPGFPVWLHHPSYPSRMVQDKDEHDELNKGEKGEKKKAWIASMAHIAHEHYPCRVHHKDYPPVLVLDSKEKAQWEAKGFCVQGPAKEKPAEPEKPKKPAKE